MRRWFSSRRSESPISDFEKWCQQQPKTTIVEVPRVPETSNPFAIDLVQFHRKCCWMEIRGAACPLHALGIAHMDETLQQVLSQDDPMALEFLQVVNETPRNHYEHESHNVAWLEEQRVFYSRIDAILQRHRAPEDIWQEYSTYRKRKHYFVGLVNVFIEELCMQYLRRTLEKLAWRMWCQRHSKGSGPV